MVLALAGTVLVGCTQSEFVGEAVQQGENNAIAFGGGTGKMTRAGDLTGADAATKLGNAMKVFGVKKTGESTYGTVFNSYSVKYSTAMTGNDEYNDGWYYVGAETGQEIKYWDYSAADYRFVAGSPVANFTFTDVTSAAVTGLGGRLNHTVTVPSTTSPVYIADPVVVAKADYQKEVLFKFRTMQSKVRVGIYETVPGYSITDIKFYATGVSDPSNYITLNSATADYFQGASTGTGTVTYTWGATSEASSYAFAYDATGLTTGQYWEGGQFTSGVPAVTSDIATLYGADTDMAADGYFVVMPTSSATAATALTLTCDYTLTALDGSETIKVKGAKATIPATYTKWEVNKAYTYLFKITDNTNGTTGEPGVDPEGLFPIVFDAVVVDVTDGPQEVGTETTVSTPSITVYQNGNVSTNGITFVAGDIEVKAAVNGADVTATWSYVKYSDDNTDKTVYNKDYEKLGASGAATTWTTGALTSVTDGVYVIKAVYNDGTKDYNAYFVLVVGAAE